MELLVRPESSLSATFPVMPPTPIRVATCDNDAMVRRAVALYIEHSPSLTLLASLTSGQQTLDYLATHEVDVLLLDVRMPEPDGFAVAERLEAMGKPCRVLYLTSYLDDRVVRDVLSGRVSGVLSKDVEPALLTKAIHVVQDGLTVIHPEALKAAPVVRTPRRQGSLALNEREEELLRLLLLGQTNVEIARTMHLSESSVKAVLATLMARAGVTNRTALVIEALEQ